MMDLGQSPADGGRPPLVVDLDGTFTLADTLWESLIRLVKRAPSLLLKFPQWLFAGRASFFFAMRHYRGVCRALR